VPQRVRHKKTAATVIFGVTSGEKDGHEASLRVARALNAQTINLFIFRLYDSVEQDGNFLLRCRWLRIKRSHR